MKKIVFVINPVSGGKDKKQVMELIKEKIPFGYEHEFIIWETPEQSAEIISRLKQEKFDIAVAAGGDGTINQVATALVNTEKTMGIIPIGSGNGLARHLNIPLDSEKAIAIILKEKIIKMDACMVNDNFFFCTSGMGFDAHIGKLFAESSTRGFFTYIKLTLLELMRYKSQQYEIKMNSTTVNHRAFLVTVANASQYGNNAYIAPQANVEDGMLDICVMKPFNILQAIGIGRKMFNKTLNTSSSMQMYRSPEATISRKSKGPLHFDGEPLMGEEKITYKVFPGALKVIVP